MITLVAQLYVAAVAAAGLCIGAWLHRSLRRSNELSVKAPSALEAWNKHSVSLHREIFA